MTISSLVALLASVDAVAAPKFAAQVRCLQTLVFAFSAEAWDEIGHGGFSTTYETLHAPSMAQRALNHKISCERLVEALV